MEVVRCDLNKLLSFDESTIRAITENAIEQANASLGGEDPAVQIENIDKQTTRLKKMIERSYRDNIAGALSDDIQEEMVKKFSREIEELTVRRKKLVEGETTAKEIRSAYGLFFDLAKRYAYVETLDRDILHTFIDRIEIGEKILPEGRKVAGPRTPYRQSIRIFYRLSGKYRETTCVKCRRIEIVKRPLLWQECEECPQQRYTCFKQDVSTSKTGFSGKGDFPCI